ncbi:MAG: hypothetical protein DPW18_05690 [Chloroflexi bacterium]|nr:hypothetical protein [Chloroflexota bacterium]MDL1942464.1 phospholipid carrier-dependent glycosyltransferase [Chloroflexi bacterium CFX2]
MEITPLWTLTPTLTALALGLMLCILARHHAWSEPQVETPPPPSEPEAEPLSTTLDFKQRTREFIAKYRWEILLSGAMLGLLVFILLSAPVQLTGKLSTYPNQPGRPFYFLHWTRNHLRLFYHETATASNLLTGLAALILVAAAGVRKSPARIRSGLLWGLLSLAGSAQWMVSSGIQLTAGVGLYLIAILGFFLWSRFARNDLVPALDERRTIPLRWEVALVVLTLALAAFGRMYALKTIPYGIEGDEAKWTAEVVSLGIRGEPDSSGLYHRDALPASFYMQTLFHKLMGPSLFAARFEVALFSVIATLVFYLFLRQITSMPLALLAAWFLSASIFDISASRLANVESHVKIWTVLTLALLVWAMRVGRWQAYAITGIALAIGLLTYDTVWPLGLVVLILVVLEARRQKESFADTSRNLAALLVPSMLATPILIPYLTGRMSYYEVGEKGWENGLVTLWDYFSEVLFSWYGMTFQDFLYNRHGPLLNAFLLPWLTFGVTAALANMRSRLASWTLIWALLFIFPVPILAHSPFGRVYYPALPAIYILAAMGMYIFARESLRALGSGLQPLAASVMFVVLVWIPLFNLYIYFNEVDDAGDRRVRREVAELAAGAADSETLLVLASVPNYNEPLNNEYQMIELYMLGKLPPHQIKESYQTVALENVLPTLPDLSPRPNRSIILDKISWNSRQERDDLAKALESCYPQAKWIKGDYFDRVDIDAEALAAPECISAHLTLEFTPEGNLAWQLSSGTASRLALKCEIQQVNHAWVEAETFPAAPGWQVETVYAINWTGDGFLMDNFGSSPVLYIFEVMEESPLYVWVRYYKRVVDNSPARIMIENNAYIFASIGEDKLNQWNWERIGPFEVTTGFHTMELHRPYLDDPTKFMALFIDSVIFTSNPDFIPSDNNYQPVRPQFYPLRQEQSRGELEPNLEPGTYRCYVEAGNRSLVDAFGRTPVRSNTIHFIVAP